MSSHILVCTDLDRTLLPNGAESESPTARPRFSMVTAQPETCIAYVTGRHKVLVEKALKSYRLPVPDFVLADVGTTIYELTDDGWSVWPEWSAEISGDWAGLDHARLQRLFKDLKALRLQENSKQGNYKLSYYVSLQVDSRDLMEEMESRLEAEGVAASLIWSIDDPAGIGLLDVLPASATKLHAIEFLMRRKGFSQEETVFAGDSGNDLPVLVSPLQAVLVANATADLREQAQRLAAQNGHAEALYLAKGGYMGMNGNYSAGILEGLAHFLPETEQWWSKIK